MPFDPTKPANGAEIIALELRDQLNALKALVDAQAAQIAGLVTEVEGQAVQIDALEVQVADMGSAINGSALNPTSVPPLSVSLSDPVTAAEAQGIVDAHNALLAALVRV